MIIIMKESASAKEIESVEKLLAEFGFQTHPIQGEKKTVIGAIGDKRLLSMNQILTMDGVENVVPIMKPYKLASKELHKEPSVIEIGHGITVGGKQLAVFAGPCAIESQEQFTTVSKAVKASGANILRGGAFKPRSSPYSFQGLEGDGLKIMYNSGQELNMPICTEVLDTRDVELVAKYADVMQIGARNMQNFELLKEAGKSDFWENIMQTMGITEYFQVKELCIQGSKFVNEDAVDTTFPVLSRNRLVDENYWYRTILAKEFMEFFENWLGSGKEREYIKDHAEQTCFLAVCRLYGFADREMVNEFYKILVAEHIR